ncbi:MAG: hypothetical protein JRN68_01465 [Nitrososphaerota archaeon]|jgi:hypothetical protein|nr:hypothetical protein [Nitrososphaerota archaeon]
MSDSEQSEKAEGSQSGVRESSKKKWYMPKYYYWGKAPPKPRAIPPAQNPEQKKFVRIMLALRFAKVAAVVIVFLLLLSRL